MKFLPKSVFRIILCWMIIFFIQRIIFLLYEIPLYNHAPFGTILLSNIYAIPYDISSACYLTSVPLILLFIGRLVGKPFFIKLTNIYNIVALVIVSILASCDILLFGQWGTRLSYKAIAFLAYPKEVMASLHFGMYIWFILFMVVQIFCGIYLFHKIARINAEEEPRIFQLLVSFIFLGLIIPIGIRGGLQKKPINKGIGYFSEYSVPNFATLNSPWNIIYELFHKVNVKTAYQFFSSGDAWRIRNHIFECNQLPNADSEIIFKTQRPNIVMIMLESWSADAISSAGGEKDVTPFFDTLCNHGIFFDHYYASGFRTEQGLASVISGFPAQPETSILLNFGKFDKLPSIVHQLNSVGYHSASYYGGDLRFANMGAYFKTSGFEKSIGGDNFKDLPKTLWGVYDEYLFDFLDKDLSTMKEPFVSLAMTLTSHEPFDPPHEPAFPGNGLGNKYRSCLHYTDDCLKTFFTRIKNEKWYANTVFILMSDHSHHQPLGRSYDEPARYHAPLLIFGEPIKDELRGMLYKKIVSQTDIPALIAGQTGVSATSFKWSKNPFSPAYPEYAYYSFDGGFGWMTVEGSIRYHRAEDKMDVSNGLNDAVGKKYLELGKSFLQCLMEEYLSF